MVRDQEDVPAFERIANKYRRLIIEGKRFPPGSTLPTIKEIAKDERVAPATAEKGVNVLKGEGLVRGRQGIGTEVLGPPATIASGSERLTRVRTMGSSWGAGERSDSHTARRVPVPGDVAQALGVPAGSEAWRRTRVYRDGHGVVAHSTSWIPCELADAVPELKRDERLDGGTSLDLIAARTGRTVATRTHETSPRIASEADLALLEQEPGQTAAILVLTSLFTDDEGRPLEFGVDLGAPGRTRRETSKVVE